MGASWEGADYSVGEGWLACVAALVNYHCSLSNSPFPDDRCRMMRRFAVGLVPLGGCTGVGRFLRVHLDMV